MPIYNKVRNIMPQSCHATKKPFTKGLNRHGADERNWTAVSTLARSRSTIELHLHNLWSGWGESNSRSNLGKVVFCHWTTPAHSDFQVLIYYSIIWKKWSPEFKKNKKNFAAVWQNRSMQKCELILVYHIVKAKNIKKGRFMKINRDFHKNSKKNGKK